MFRGFLGQYLVIELMPFKEDQTMRIKPQSFFTLLLFGLCLSVGAGYAEAKKPNILVIWGDDVGITCIVIRYSFTGVDIDISTRG